MSQRDHHSARPLSPHLQIWRWGPHMLTSILHRVTGNGLALVGLAVLVWWLGALASGPEAYESFRAVAGSPFGLIVLIGLSWAFFNHMMSGLRHFVLDIGAGYELDTNRFWSIASPILGIVLTVAFWTFIILRDGGMG
ncbi:MAG: succinate dehydrogenase, cytochrome b556 subunit [Erythrobacter sp.]